MQREFIIVNQGRVVLRYHYPASAHPSLPVHGRNVNSQQMWLKKIDSLYGKYPRLSSSCTFTCLRS